MEELERRVIHAIKRFAAVYGAHACFVWAWRVWRMVQQGRCSRKLVPLLVGMGRAARQTLRSQSTLRVAVACASWGPAYRLVSHFGRTSFAAEGSAWQPSVVAGLAGAAAGAVAASALPPGLRKVLAPHAAVRGLSIIASGQAARYSPLQRSVAPVVLFCASSAVVMWCWFYAPQALPRSYRQWITVMADMDSRLLHALRELRAGRLRYGTPSAFLAEYCADHGLLSSAGDPGLHKPLPCSTVHPASGDSCRHNVQRRWLRGFTAALLLHAPLSGIAAVAGAAVAAAASAKHAPQTGRWEVALRHFRSHLASGVSNAARRSVRSGAFLATFIATIWGAICCSRNVLQDDVPWGPGLGCCLAGLSCLIEPHGRRVELALYVLPRALQSVWELSGAPPPPAGFGRALLTLASACMAAGSTSANGGGGTLEAGLLQWLAR